MSDEQLRIKEYSQALDLLEDFKKEVEAGNVMSLVIVAECTNGDMRGGTTATQNVYAVAGYMLAWALRRMSFTTFDDVRKVVSAALSGE